jgi:hypothetical protein
MWHLTLALSASDQKDIGRTFRRKLLNFWEAHNIGDYYRICNNLGKCSSVRVQLIMHCSLCGLCGVWGCQHLATHTMYRPYTEALHCCCGPHPQCPCIVLGHCGP